MKDNVKIYDIPPKLLPDTAQSLTIEIDYSVFEHLTDDQLLDKDSAGFEFWLCFRLFMS